MTGSILIYAPVPVHRNADGGLLVEAQAVNGLRLWAANFDRVTALMPLDPGPAPAGWVPLPEGGLPGIRIETLPVAWRPDRFLRAWGPGLRRIRALIPDSDYLSFAIGGLFGDWGAVAAFEAHRQGRPFAVWTDRVESEVVRRSAASGPWRARLRSRLLHRPMAALERAVMRRAALGLLHGQECLDAYAPHLRGPAELVHDIHLAPRDHLAPEAVEAKAQAAGEGPLRLAYVGRAEAMKGPMDWLATVGRLHAAGVDVRATWLGDGSLLPAMRARVDAAGLGAVVDLPGFTDDRARVLGLLRRSHALLFCHQTPESPRCLIEALASACPILGYRSGFPASLIQGHGGGVLTERGDVAALADAAASLAADRGRLAGLIRAAAADGAPFTDEAVFRHRSEAIRRHLPGPHAAATGGSG